MKIIKSDEKSYFLIRAAREKIDNEAKEQKGRFCSMLLGKLSVRFLWNLLSAGEAATIAG